MKSQTHTTAQSITPELRAWVVEQASAGHPPEVVLQSMLASGWQEEVAIAALECSIEQHIATVLPPEVPVPVLALQEQPLYLDLGDRRVTVLSVLHKPQVVVLGDFLSAEECDALMDAARPRLARSLTVASKTGGEEVNADRTSNGMFFTRGENAVVQRIEARLARLTQWPLENGEGLQILQYGPGAQYRPHYDYFDPKEPGTPTIVKRGGQRVATIIMYLAEPEKGGGTTFPDVGLEVAPKRGNAVFFSYTRAHPSSQSLHGGAPVIEGEKWIATKWLREREFV